MNYIQVNNSINRKDSGENLRLDSLYVIVFLSGNSSLNFSYRSRSSR